MTEPKDDASKSKAKTKASKGTSSAKKGGKRSSKKRQGFFERTLTNLTLILLALLIVLAFVSWQGLLTPLSFAQKKQVLSIKPGQTYYGLIDDWAADEKIKYPDLAKLYVKYFVNKPLLAGAYEIPEKASLSTVLGRIARGEQAQMIRLSIIEGKTYKDLLARIENTKYAEQTLKNENNGDVGEYNLMQILGLPEAHPEGWFAPNTYYFSHGSSDKTILKHLYEAQKRILKDEWSKRAPDLPYANPYEALIMASIIEKETGLPDERDMVAGVFVNRLRKGMRLQTDPTVIYGMGERYDGNIRKKDLLEKTAYNTYQIDGLPPTPIALPSQASIHAALHPAETDALFFVATGDGGHTFTKTYAEHQLAVGDYLNNLRQKRNAENTQNKQPASKQAEPAEVQNNANSQQSKNVELAPANQTAAKQTTTNQAAANQATLKQTTTKQAKSEQARPIQAVNEVVLKPVANPPQTKTKADTAPQPFASEVLD